MAKRSNRYKQSVEKFDRAKLYPIDEAFGIRKKRGLSKVIESPYGFHIFKLEARIKAQEASFEDVREDIALDLERTRLEELRREWLRGLRRQADIRVNDKVLEALR